MDPDHFGNLGPDPHQGNKPDPAPHKKAGSASGSASKASASNKNQDPDPHPHQTAKSDPHQSDADPQHCSEALLVRAMTWEFFSPSFSSSN
jgi:hypothetical protein